MLRRAWPVFCVLSIALSTINCDISKGRGELSPEALGKPFLLVTDAENAKAWRQPDGTIFVRYTVEADPDQIRGLLSEETSSSGWVPVQSPWFGTWHEFQEGSGSESTNMLKTVWRGEDGHVFSYNIEHKPGVSGIQDTTIKMWMLPPSLAAEYVERWTQMNNLADEVTNEDTGPVPGESY
jgi:hypothetical protein